MNQATENLFKEIETGSIEEKSGSLLVLGDDIEFAHFKPEVIQEIVQRLINILSGETEWQVIKLLFRNISIAYMQQVDLHEINYDRLINMMNTVESKFINGVLYLLSMTYNKKYIPVISKYLEHPDETVRKEALDALAYLNNL